MTIEEIQQRKEDQTFDCKSIQIDPKALAVPIVAMANADGGVIAVGVSDKSRRIEGIDQHTEKLNELLRVAMDYCAPSVRVQYSYLPCKDIEGRENRILLIQVPASSHLHVNQADEAFMRVGDKSRKLGFDERVQLMYDKGERSYEDEAVYGATLDDIDMAAVGEYIDIIGYRKSALEYLRENNDFVKETDGREKVSNACILLFGKNPQRFFPRARTRFIRYEGRDEKVGTAMNVVKDVTFEGTILSQINKTVEYIETQVREHTFLGQDGLFVTNRDYPKFALQELVVNACCHRDYSIKGTEIQIKMFDDRLVFESPGRLPGLVRADNIRHTHFSRNPKIAQFLKAYKFVKEFGEGIDRICCELETRGAAIPSFRVDAFILRATLRSELAENETISEKISEKPQSETDKEITERQRLILDIIASDNTLSAKSISEKISEKISEMSGKPYSVTDRTIESDIERLKASGILGRIGGRKDGHWEILIRL